MRFFRSKFAPRTDGLPWLAFVLFVILALAFLLPIQPNDYWWYVRLGQDVLRERAIPTRDTFSYTQAGQPVVYHSWLAAVLFAVLRAWGGNPLTIFLRGLLLALFYGVTWRTCRLAGAGPKLAAGLTLLAALAGSKPVEEPPT